LVLVLWFIGGDAVVGWRFGLLVVMLLSGNPRLCNNALLRTFRQISTHRFSSNPRRYRTPRHFQ
jgi:hypothetical protein